MILQVLHFVKMASPFNAVKNKPSGEMQLHLILKYDRSFDQKICQSLTAERIIQDFVVSEWTPGKNINKGQLQTSRKSAAPL